MEHSDADSEVKEAVLATWLETILEILANVCALCPCPKNLLETTLRNFGLMTGVEETEDSSVLTVTWF